ncbi:cilia- and flagella-associated protein 44 [Cololabis saira]|uniref:cilia- and flagella-associated protein 44 n=1 Tax=Cololabis saira TaxID=129043 RepID=UPI002AD53A57|nr:cilia- and flagella-associated protein 44 [Cololabis saira]
MEILDENVSSVYKEAETTNRDLPENAEGAITEPSAEQLVLDGEPEKQLPIDMFYNYEELSSRPYITPDSEIQENLLHLFHSFGYDSGRRANLKLLDDRTLIFIAGNLLVLLDFSSKEQRFLRSCGGGGIGAITVHPTKSHFAVAEKGYRPNIIIYEYPSLKPYRNLRGGTELGYSSVDFNCDGTLLVSASGTPNCMLTVWDWRQEKVVLRSTPMSNEIYRVSFNPYNSDLLTSSGFGHIKFWKKVPTFTGHKLQGSMSNFGITVPTDIEGYVELPDGKVVSGTEWGNLLLWDGNAVKVEICRKENRNCHVGTVQPFAIEDGQLMTIGSDGVVRGWDFDGIDTAIINDGSSKFEMEPINEMVVGHNVCLSSVVRSSPSDSSIWFAQDANGAIWKLDLSFTNTAADPECLFSFHAGPIQGLDVSKKSHLMATTTLDRSVRVFDFLTKRELTTSHFNQGGTTLSWAPLSINPNGSLLVTGFQDGVVRLLELYNPQKLTRDTGRDLEEDAKLQLKQAFKPHNAPVTAVAYERNGEIFATGSVDCTVFFFTTGEKYNPIGFILVPGPVQALEWSPHSHSENRLLILCQNGYVVEVHSPDPEAQMPTKTFQLTELPRRFFKFKSIKSRIKREEEIARRQALKKQQVKEKEEELPPLYIPDPPSPISCGFYSQSGQFWLSMGGFDSGYLYHCKFSENQDDDPDQRQDEPFHFLPVNDADDDPICSMTFSSNRQLLLCGMHSGFIRIYPLQPGDHSLTSMEAYWAISIHDNHYGHLRHIRCSHDDLFVLTAGDDGNMFSFSLLPQEELQEKSLHEKTAEVPSPTICLEKAAGALDIEDPTAHNIEMAKKKLENDHLRRESELKVAETQKQLAELQKKYNQVLRENQRLPEHIRLKPEELQLDPRFRELAEQLKAKRVREVRKQMAWEQERCSIALRKLQDWCNDSLEGNIVTVVAIRTNHRISTYHLSMVADSQVKSSQVEAEIKLSQPGGIGEALGVRKSRIAASKDSHQIVEEELPPVPVARAAKINLGDRQEEKLRKAAEKAERARTKIEKRNQEWAQIYAEKPEKDYVDPKDVQAICEARQNIGDFIRVKHLRINSEKKKEEKMALAAKIRETQTEMNERITTLHNSKVHLVSWLAVQAEKLKKIQEQLPANLHRYPPSLPTILPAETSERSLPCGGVMLVKEQSSESVEEQYGAVSVLEQLQKGEEEITEAVSPNVSTSSSSVKEGVELTELEMELQREQEIRLQYDQDCLLQQMESSISEFDAQLLLLLRQKSHLDCQLKLEELHLLTISQEIFLLKQFEKREGCLQEKLNGCIQEEKSIKLMLDECNEQLELKKGHISKLQEKEKSLTAAFQTSLGESNRFEDFLTMVFKKNIKRAKTKEKAKNEEEEHSSSSSSSEDSEDDIDWDVDYDSSEEGGAALDVSVCPKGCEPKLYENTLQLRERRLDLKEHLVEQNKIAETLKREKEMLTKKVKIVNNSRQAIEEGLELINKEKQQKLDELDVVIPLRRDQIEFVIDGSVPSDLSEALVLDKIEQRRLQERIQQLKVEKLGQKELCHQAHQKRARLTHELKEMATRIQVLELQCDELMMKKFGRLVDLEALQMIPGSRRLEELKYEKLLKEKAHAKELKQWDVKVEEAQDALMKVTRRNTEHLCKMSRLLEQKKELNTKLNTRQKKMARRHFQPYRALGDQESMQRLQELVKKQSLEAQALRREISLLSSKGGHILGGHHIRLPPITPRSSPIGDIHKGKPESN